MTNITVGTRVWHGGNMAMDEATGTVSEVIGDRGTIHYRISWDAQEGQPARRDMVVPACAFDPAPARFWTLEDRKAHVAAEFARLFPSRRPS